MPVQAVYKFTEHGDDRRIIAGRVEAGKVAVGDKVVFSPSNKISTIKSIEGFNAEPRTSIDAGWSTGFTLTEEIYVTRGEVMSQVDKPPLVSTRIAHQHDLAGQEPVRHGQATTSSSWAPPRCRCSMDKINKVIDASALDRELEKDSVGRHDVADVVLEVRQPIAFDLTADCEATGRFVIVDGYDIAGGGIITAAVADELRDLRAEARMRDFNWVEGGVTAADRAHRAGHRAALVMFVGKSRRRQAPIRARAGAGAVRRRPQRLHARRQERLARRRQRHDGSTPRSPSWCAGSARSCTSCSTPACIVVSTTNVIGLADATAVQALIPDSPMLLVDIDPDGLEHAGLRPAHQRQRARGRRDREDRRPARPPRHHHPRLTLRRRPGQLTGGARAMRSART